MNAQRIDIQVRPCPVPSAYGQVEITIGGQKTVTLFHYPVRELRDRITQWVNPEPADPFISLPPAPRHEEDRVESLSGTR